MNDAVKKHKQDKAIVYVLKEYQVDKQWAISVMSEILWHDPGAGVAKHGMVHAMCNGTTGIVRMCDIDTWATFDGTYANSHTGVTRKTLDLMEAFYNGTVPEGSKMMTLREARVEVFERAKRLSEGS